MNWTFQLYSARKTPLQESLKIIADAGYAGVEAFRDNFSDPYTFKAELEKYQLVMVSMHINIEQMRNDFDACVNLAREFSCQHIVCPYLDVNERPQDVHGWKMLASELSGFARQWRDVNCHFSWHNHDFEFMETADGIVPIELLLDHAPEMQWEVDVAWIVRSGVSAQPWIERYCSRISALHLKDIAPLGERENEDGWADLGDGIVPWVSLSQTLQKTAVSMYCMEHDNPSDLARFANRSIDYANRELSQFLAQV